MSISPIARLRSRYVSLIAVLSVLITLVIFLIGFSLRVLKDVPFRQAFVVTTNPMRIISWDRQRTAMQIVSLPKDILIDGAFGYGQYSLSALSALDALDHKNGLLLIQSVAQAVGVPISGAIFVDSTESEASALDSLKKYSPGDLLQDECLVVLALQLVYPIGYILFSYCTHSVRMMLKYLI